MEKNSVKIYIPFWITVVILLLYINLFKNFKILFWITFGFERIFNAIYIDKMLRKIDKLIEQREFNGKLFGIIMFTILLGIGIFIWIFIDQRELFYVIILGEIFDFIILKILKLRNQK